MEKQIQHFYDLAVWKQAHELALEIYALTKSFPREELFGVTSQLRRAAMSVAANIAEGFGRFHFKDKIRFYYQARGSLAETQNHLLFVRDLRLIETTRCAELISKAEQLHQLINGLIRSIEKQIEV